MEYHRYTLEQQEKIDKLRSESEKEQESNKYRKGLTGGETGYRSRNNLEVGDRVYVVLGGLTVIGYLVQLHKEKKWVKWTKSIKHKIIVETFDVSTPYGKLKNIERKNLNFRPYEDLSHVVIPEALKEISTVDLLSEVRRDYTGYYANWDDNHYRPATRDFSTDEIRAELRNRPNVRRNKKVKKMLKKFM